MLEIRMYLFEHEWACETKTFDPEVDESGHRSKFQDNYNMTGTFIFTVEYSPKYARFSSILRADIHF